MTNKKEVAQKVMNEFFDKLGPGPYHYDNFAVSAALRELVFQLQYYNTSEGEDMILDARAILDVVDELENL